jgi:hypothetical protein
MKDKKAGLVVEGRMVRPSNVALAVCLGKRDGTRNLEE